MSRAKTKKKNSSKITRKIENRIVDLSLQNPDFGARRLVALLLQEKISVSSAQVYNTLRRNNLQSRQKRLAKLEKQGHESKSPPKKTPAGIADELAERIVEISLKNPECGAKSLVSLLKGKEIFVSASTVYRILKRHGLGSRQKRLAKIKKRLPESKPISKKPTFQITDEVAERIVQISLQNPEYGARRLMPLLQKEEILASASAVYTVLKRNGIQTREKRFARNQAQYGVEELQPQDIEIPSPQVTEISPEPAVAIQSPAKQPEQVPDILEEKASLPQALPVSKRSEKIKTRGPWFLSLLNILLLLLLLFLGFYTWQNVHTAILEPQSIATINHQSTISTVEPQVAPLPLNDYRMVWERNLFNVSKQKAPAPKKEIEIEKIDPAEKDLGLTLVGTAVAADPSLSRAFIENRRTRDQEAYREGDKVNEVLIKKITRNKVIITTKEGDKLLAVDFKKSTKSSRASTYARQFPRSSGTISGAQGSAISGSRSKPISLNREELEASLADMDQLLETVKISPYMQGDQPAGFRINRVLPQSVLRKMGLRSRDVIIGVNDQDITSQDQASEFFQTLAEGGEITLKIKRRRRSRQIKLNIE